MFIKDYSSAFFYSTKVVGTHWSYYFKYVSPESPEEADEVRCSGVLSCLAKISLTLVPFLRYFLLDSLGIAIPAIFEDWSEL